MDSGVNMMCFAASYAVAFALELSGLWRRLFVFRVAEILAATAGLVAHTWYLGRRVSEIPAAPLSSQQDWFVLAAWILAVVYLAAKFYYPRTAIGLFLLPGVLGLVGASTLASAEPLATFQAPRVWGRVHGVFLLVGTTAVLVGFIAGLMYLIQSYRLKHKKSLPERFRLPSLEWLERANSRALAIATVSICGGFFTGILSRMAQQGPRDGLAWGDPVVLSLAAMMLWLLASEVFRLIYPAARQGRKVAYLTMAAFVFLLLVFATVTLGDKLHTQPSASAIPSATSSVEWGGGG